MPDTFGADGPRLSSQQWRAVWTVLDPVRHELTTLSSWEWQRTVGDIVRQLDDGAAPDRLRDRLQHRYTAQRPLSPGYERWLADQADHDPDLHRWRSFPRWLIGAALVRHGCGRPDCESGTIWPTGDYCELCSANRQAAATRAQRETELGASERRVAEQRRQREAQTRAVAGGQEQPGPATDATRKQLPAQPCTDPSSAPAAEVVPLRPAAPWPARATDTERATATAADIRTAITRHGAAAAVHVYGLRLVAPHLTETTDDRRTDYAQCQ